MGNKQSRTVKPGDFKFPESKRIWIENWKKENRDNPRVVFFPGKEFPKINPVEYSVKESNLTNVDMHIQNYSYPSIYLPSDPNYKGVLLFVHGF